MLYFTVYKTTNLLNGKEYIGVHKTQDLNDGYYGSNKQLKKDIKQFGEHNFKKEIIYFCEDEKTMFLKESELVTYEYCLRENTYNLNPGGCGGFTYINENGLHQDRSELGKRGGKMAHVVLKRKRSANTEYNNQYMEVMRIFAKKGREIQKIKYPEGIWKGKKHKEETKKKIGEKNSIHQQGSGNSQYGTCWITNGKENKKIKKEDLDNLETGWYKGRVL